MTKDEHRRRARRKLAAHDRGEDRHNRALAWMKKINRQHNERERTKRG